MKKILAMVLLVYCVCSGQLQAAQLFGIELADATRDQLRGAVKKAGAKLLREAGQDTFYDVYQSDQLVHGSSNLYLGFVKQDRKFAFAEYELNGLQQPRLLRLLTGKYGNPQVSRAKFFSDRTYRWQSKGIDISLHIDWNAYKTRLTYLHAGNLQRLKSEQQNSVIRTVGEDNRYLPQAY